jgi:putative oxidoreductase
MNQDYRSRLNSYNSRLQSLLESLAPATDLISRLYIARVFLLSGWSKISDWNTTLFLFTSEYHVPLLPPQIAAVSATFGELVFSILLLMGAYTQASALGLFIINIVAVASYYQALSSSPAAIMDHLQWGIIISLLMISRNHPWGLDRYITTINPGSRNN